MEALVAVGLAGNVVQFITSAGTFLKEANEIRKSGSPLSLPKLKTLTEVLTRQAALLKTRLEASSAVKTLAEEDQNLLDLTVECEEAGNHFLTYLETLLSHSASKLIRTTKTAVKFKWSAHKIEDYVSRLEKLRTSLTLATVLAFRTSAESSNVEVLAHLKEIQRDLRNKDLDEEKIRTTIEVLADNVRHQISGPLGSLRLEIQAGLNEISNLRTELPLEEKAHSRENEILRWLDFRQISWRYEGIQQAYRETYGWIFEAPEGSRPWDDFSSYLEQNAADPYFIQGKAGSGKSTLMKFISRHPRTESALKRWAGPDQLLVLPFFFWNLGTTLQKTHVGMLRALLHAALDEHPELIPAVLPKQYRNWDNASTESEPDYVEIKRAFELFIEKSRYLRIAILIDGIDEFAGDDRDLSLFLRALVSPRLKLIVSSRPVNGCLSALTGCPGLRLQDLTRNDMESFVHGELSTHHLMVRLTQRFPDRAPQLGTDIVDKAEGVFLWVTLVVRLLIKGLENGDDLDELQTRLTSLPSDLKDLYRRMFGRMKVEYQIQAATIFQLVRKWNDHILDQPLPGLVLSYALAPPSAALTASVARLTNESFDWSISHLDMRVKSRCCGLLEVRDGQCGFPAWATAMLAAEYISLEEINRSVVTYLHRTVAEFIAIDEVWQEICGLTKDTPFVAATHLSSACLSMMKVAKALDDQGLAWYLAATTMFLRKATNLSPSSTSVFMGEIDKTMSEFQQKSQVVSDNPLSGHIPHWSAATLRNAGLFSERISPQVNYSIHTYAAATGLLLQSVTDMSHVDRFGIVQHALSSWLVRPEPHRYLPSLEERLKTLSYLLKNVSSPESIEFGESLWQHAFPICLNFQAHSEYIESAELLKAFLGAAKSPQALLQQPNAYRMLPNSLSLLEALKPGYESFTKKRTPPLCGDALWDQLERLISPNVDVGGKAESESARSNRTGGPRRNGKKARRAKKLQAREIHVPRSEKLCNET
ncbi:Nn.00g106020.m01.CDS01 [Neocucurbitaria sp. VM-36]